MEPQRTKEALVRYLFRTITANLSVSSNPSLEDVPCLQITTLRSPVSLQLRTRLCSLGLGSILSATGKCIKTVPECKSSTPRFRGIDEVLLTDDKLLPWVSYLRCLRATSVMAVRQLKIKKLSFRIQASTLSMVKTTLFRTQAPASPSKELPPRLLPDSLRPPRAPLVQRHPTLFPVRL